MSLGAVGLSAVLLASTSYAQTSNQVVNQAVPAVVTIDSPALSAPNYDQNAVATTDVNQDYCIAIITGFPNEDQVSRYQFFKLTDELAVDVDPDFKAALIAHRGDPFPEDIPVLDVIEVIANPVLRQAAPEVVVSAMHHLIDFNQKCDPYLSDQA